MHIKWCFSTGPYELSPRDQTRSINSNLPLTKQCGRISRDFGTSEFVTSRLLLPSLSTLRLLKPELPMHRNACRVLSHDSIAFRNFGNLGNEIPNSYPPKCRNVEFRHASPIAGPTQIFSPLRDFALRDFVNLATRLSVLQLMKPRNGQQRFDLCVDKYATCPLSTVYNL
jgi:hypothetical protein